MHFHCSVHVVYLHVCACHLCSTWCCWLGCRIASSFWKPSGAVCKDFLLETQPNVYWFQKTSTVNQEQQVLYKAVVHFSCVSHLFCSSLYVCALLDSQLRNGFVPGIIVFQCRLKLLYCVVKMFRTYALCQFGLKQSYCTSTLLSHVNTEISDCSRVYCFSI